MSRPWVLESFDDAEKVSALSTDNALEEERLQSFDKGYRAGWDDAAAALAQEQGRISAELAGNLQGLSFTYHEARSAVLGEMEGLLRGLVERVLPETMIPSLGEMISEQVRSAAESSSEVDVEIVVCPENVDRVQRLVEGMVAPPLVVLPEASLGEGQAYLRMGHSEQKIDLEDVLKGLSEAVAEFFEQSDQEEVASV